MDIVPVRGMKFVPTDYELVAHYLYEILLKGVKLPFDAGLIHLCNVYGTEPWNLPNEFKYGVRTEAYYFTERNCIGGKGTRVDRMAGAGSWKATGSDKEVRTPDGAVVVGHVMHLCYVRENERGSSSWVMDEYRLPRSPHYPSHFMNYAICRIKRNATAEKRMGREKAHAVRGSGGGGAAIDEEDSDHQHLELYY